MAANILWDGMLMVGLGRRPWAISPEAFMVLTRSIFPVIFLFSFSVMIFDAATAVQRDEMSSSLICSSRAALIMTTDMMELVGVRGGAIFPVATKTIAIVF
jgi:hypothetical protein